MIFRQFFTVIMIVVPLTSHWLSVRLHQYLVLLPHIAIKCLHEERLLLGEHISQFRTACIEVFRAMATSLYLQAIRQ